MPVKFQCKCGVMYRVPDEKFGRKLRCKKCAHEIIVSPKRNLHRQQSGSRQSVNQEDDFELMTDVEVVDDFELDDDWHQPSADDQPRVQRSVLRESALPPKVITGRNFTKVDAVVDRTAPRHVDAEPASEFLAPLIVAVAGLIITVAASLLLKPDGIPTGIWLGIRLGLIAASLVITFGALFLATLVVEAEYGYISTGLLKVTAIVLTQNWVGDIASAIPVPFVGGLLAFLTTYAMFKYFFGLDDMEAIASMFVVRIVHWIVFSFLFITLLGIVLSGKNIELPDIGGWDMGAPQAEAPIEDDEADVPGIEMPEEEIGEP